MKFLLEKQLISEDEYYDFQTMSNNEKRKFISNWIDNLGDRKGNLNLIRNDIEQSIMDYGFDDNENKFLKYILKLKQLWFPFKLSHNIAKLIMQLMNDDSLNPTSNATQWLYRKDLYNDSEENTLFKIKALTYASDRNMQRDASRNITAESLMDKSGNLLSADKMRNILSRIKIQSESQLTIENAINKLFGYVNLSNDRNVEKLKNYLKTLIAKDSEYSSYMDNIIDRLSIQDIIRIPIFRTDEDSLRNGLIKYLSGNSKLVRKDKRDKEVNIKQLASKVKKSEPEVKTAVEDVITNDEGDLIKSTAAQVLTKLGISEKQARNIVNDLYRPGMSSEEILNAYGIGKSTT